MSAYELNDEQVRTWTREQKDKWWLDNVYKGDMPQLTLRSAVLGFLLGGVLAATGLYIAARTGISIGVGLISVILAFGIFRSLSKSGAMRDLTVLENNCTQSIATSAGYIQSALIAGITAYMVITGVVIPWWQLVIWLFCVGLTGVLLAFPLKRKFVNDDQLPFPEGRACGVVLQSLYSGEASDGMYKARLLAKAAALAATVQALISDGWMTLLQFKLLAMDKWAGMTQHWQIHERIDQYYYDWAARANGYIPSIMGTDLRTMGIRLALDLGMFGTGGLMGIAVAASVMLGCAINFFLLAPWMIAIGDITPRVLPSGATVPLSRVEIVNQWSLWWGVVIMVVGSLVSLFGRPEIFRATWATLKNLGRKAPPRGPDVLAHIEVPLWISYVFGPIVAFLGAYTSHLFFGVPLWMAVLALPLIAILAVIATQSMALTSWAPTGALSKITQFSMGALDRTNPAANLMPAAMTSEVAMNAASLLSDIKPGYMLGGKPRHQIIGHIIGMVAGIACAVPLYYLLFLRPDASGVVNTANIISDRFAFPAAVQWQGVASMIANGLKGVPQSAVTVAIVAGVVGALIEIIKIRTRGRFPLSAVSIGLGVVLPGDASIMMFLGALFFWIMSKRYSEVGTPGWKRWVDGCEPIAAGLITGSALMGIGNALITTFVL